MHAHLVYLSGGWSSAGTGLARGPHLEERTGGGVWLCDPVAGGCCWESRTEAGVRGHAGAAVNRPQCVVGIVPKEPGPSHKLAELQASASPTDILCQMQTGAPGSKAGRGAVQGTETQNAFLSSAVGAVGGEVTEGGLSSSPQDPLRCPPASLTNHKDRDDIIQNFNTATAEHSAPSTRPS